MRNRIVGSKTNEFINSMKKYGIKNGIKKSLKTANIIFIIIRLLIFFIFLWALHRQYNIIIHICIIWKVEVYYHTIIMLVADALRVVKRNKRKKKKGKIAFYHPNKKNNKT